MVYTNTPCYQQRNVKTEKKYEFMVYDFIHVLLQIGILFMHAHKYNTEAVILCGYKHKHTALALGLIYELKIPERNTRPPCIDWV
jgi:hypothetical protein